MLDKYLDARWFQTSLGLLFVWWRSFFILACALEHHTILASDLHMLSKQFEHPQCLDTSWISK